MTTNMLDQGRDESDGLFPADVRVGIRPYLLAVWDRRDYIRHVARSQLRSQQMHTVLGNLWHLLNPALQIAVFYLIFGVVLDVTRGVDNLLAFISVGLFSYQYSTASITDASKSIAGNRALLKSIWFPRALLPITATVAQLFAFLPTLVVMAMICIVTGEPVRLTWLLVPVIVVLQTMLNIGLALIAARSANHVEDIQNLLPFIFRLLLYGSGVLFVIDEYVQRSAYQLLFELNPFYGIVTTWRWAVLGSDMEAHVAVYTIVISLVTVVAGFVWFHRGERGYTDGV